MSVNSLIAQLKTSLGSSQKRLDPAAGIAKPLYYVVDDEPDIQNLISAALKGLEIEIKTFDSARSLMDGLAQRHPQLIFLDLSLEGSDAVEILHDLKRIGFQGRVTLMSGHHRRLLEDVKAIGEVHKLQMNVPLLKPFSIDTVRKIAAAGLPIKPKVEPKIAIDEALKHGWMKVYYQPKIDLKAKMLVGGEAFATIVHPEQGVVSFNDANAQSDPASLAELATFVLITLLKDSVKFRDAGLSFKPAFKISVDTLMNLPIAKIVRSNRPNDDAWKGLFVEVAEEQIVHDVTQAHVIATQLRIYDVSLSIHSFGAGYSSPVQLANLPFAELKLDRSLVNGCGHSSQNAAICKTAIDLAHSLNTVAVAEGIEKQEDLRALLEMGCDIGQGNLLAKTLPIERFLDSLRQRQITPSTAVRKLTSTA